MKKILYTFLLVYPLLFIYSCEEEGNNVQGCLDSNATNYNENATIDNNSCCYDCYIGEALYGNFCGADALEIEANGVEEYAQVYENGLPLFDGNGNPVMAWQSNTVDCDGL